MITRRMPIEGNPYYPLAPNYPSLSPEEQRLSRINAVSHRETPEDFVAAWAFFREYYLFPTPKGQFYKHGVVPSPKYHYEMVYDYAAYPLNACGAPRSGAKSTVIGCELPLMELVSRENFEVGQILAGLTQCKKRMDRIMIQLDKNPRIIQDFGKLRPNRGDGIWNREMLRLRNGSTLWVAPIKGQLLGERPSRLIIDDAEFDPAMVHRPSPRTALMEYLLNTVILPMMEAGTCLYWIGTLHRKDFLIHRVATSDEPKYRGWNRRIITVYEKDGSLSWPEKLSEKFLEAKRRVMGEAAWRASYLNKPTSTFERTLQIDEEMNTYTVEGGDPWAVDQTPFPDTAQLVSHIQIVGSAESENPVRQVIKRSWGEVISKSYRILTVDPARTVRATSDYSALVVTGIENSEQYRDTVWVLDCKLVKATQDQLIREIFRMAERWRVNVVGIESVGEQIQLQERAELELGRLEGDNWKFRLWPVRYQHGMDKGERIAMLEWRFNQYRIKFPKHLEGVWPWREFRYQIDNFTIDLAQLSHDDAIDALAMLQWVVRPRKGAELGGVEEAFSGSIIERLKRGERFTEIGSPVANLLSSQEITPEIFNLIRTAAREEMEDAIESGKVITWL